jgi:REP element-mobilizing transposase RayT
MVLNGAGSIALDCLCAIPGHFPTVDLDAFTVMPNHVHFLVIVHDDRDHDDRDHDDRDHDDRVHDDRDHDVGATHASPLRTMTVCGPRAGSLGAIVGSFKSAVTRRVNELRGSPGARLWQRNYYERIVRDEAELRRIRGYIASNPAKWDTDENNPRGGRMRRPRGVMAMIESALRRRASRSVDAVVLCPAPMDRVPTGSTARSTSAGSAPRRGRT